MHSHINSIVPRRLVTSVCLAALLSAIALAQAPRPASGIKYSQISPADMKEWLSYLASDELQGRQIYTEGFGLAAQYVSERLKDWGVKSLNPDGTYFQPVQNKGYRGTRTSSVTITPPDG